MYRHVYSRHIDRKIHIELFTFKHFIPTDRHIKKERWTEIWTETDRFSKKLTNRQTGKYDRFIPKSIL